MSFNLKQKLEIPVIGILRGIEVGFFQEVMETSFAAGLQAIEITMNTKDAPQIVSSNIPNVPPGKLLGMGTIRSIDEAKIAVKAGAMFLVTPNTDTQVIEYAISKDVPVIAGAFTPTEVYTAWAAGASMIKIFPCGMFGPKYIRELHGPFDQISLVAVGGITSDNIKDYFEAGACAVGAGTSLFGRKALMEHNLEEIAKNVNTFISLCPDWKK
jgi:2-dehydro-3-deoxyphosphogluconate aldolase/(4S)-4-hydroxy-2-oxoglutarate aldolase